jgi:hypothetical protein
MNAKLGTLTAEKEIEIVMEASHGLIYKKDGNYHYVYERDCVVIEDILKRDYERLSSTTANIHHTSDDFDFVNSYKTVEWEELEEEEKKQVLAEAHDIYISEREEYDFLEIENVDMFIHAFANLLNTLKNNGYTVYIEDIHDEKSRHILVLDKFGNKQSVPIRHSKDGIEIKHNYITWIVAHSHDFVLSYLKNNFHFKRH